jgi:hypothetical protein
MRTCKGAKSQYPEAMLDHKQDLLLDNFQSLVLTVGGQPDRWQP